MYFENFQSGFWANLLGGIVLAFLVFFVRHRILALPKITGQWYFELHTLNTVHEQYNNMILRYVAMLWQEGNRVEGTVEKIYEISSTGERAYIGTNRTRGKIKGYIDKKYFGKDLLYLHMVEEGHGRESTSFYELSVDSDSIMTGTFDSMVAHQNGNIRWQREEF